MSQNNQNTFEQQGSRLQQLSKSRKSNLAVAVFAILAFHAAVFGGLLIQGCKPEPTTTNTNNTETNQPGALVVPDDVIFTEDPLGVSSTVAELPPPVQPQGETNVTASAIQPIPPVPEPPPVVTTTNAAAAPTEPKAAPTATEYLVVQNDNFYSIAKKFPGVSVADIKAANPDVDPTRMKVGQKLVIPAPKETPAKAGESAKAAEADSGNTYTVVAGDNLTVIAKKYKITVAELKKANNMTTDRINVGQKLQIPAASTGTSAAKTASAPTTASSSTAASPTSAPAASGAPVVQTPPSAAAITNTITKTPL